MKDDIVLEIGLDGEEELVDENAFESSDIVLLVEHQHGLFVSIESTVRNEIGQ